VKRRLERASEVLAMEEMLTEGIQRALTEGAGLVLEGWRQRGEQQVGLEERGEGGVVKAGRSVGAGHAGEADGCVWLSDGRGVV